MPGNIFGIMVFVVVSFVVCYGKSGNVILLYSYYIPAQIAMRYLFFFVNNLGNVNCIKYTLYYIIIITLL